MVYFHKPAALEAYVLPSYDLANGQKCICINLGLEDLVICCDFNNKRTEKIPLKCIKLTGTKSIVI